MISSIQQNNIQNHSHQHQNHHYPHHQNNNNNQTYVDPQFQTIIKNKLTFFIWRIEGLHLVPVPKDSYGVFFKSDTYLVFSSSDANQKLSSQHIHLWIGSNSTTDQQGIGAFKMVELDDFLGGSPIQHRECQNFESERFLNYFKQRGGIKYQNGGCSTGLHHYEKKFEPRLFQVKGKRATRLSELNNIDWSSLNRNDSFLIDLNTTIFIWNGRNSNKLEKLQALNKARLFRDERNGYCNIVIVEDGEEKDMSKDELRLFETKFPLKEKISKLKNELPVNNLEDLKHERESASYLKLYKCSDARDEEDGTVKIKIIEQKTGPLYKEDLSSDESFIIDNGKAGIWVWIGKKSGPKERQESMRNALGFLQAKGFDERQQNAIKVTRVIDGCEPVEFRALFNRWPELNEQKGLGRIYSINSTAKTAQANYDANVLHANHQLAAESQMIDDGKGFKEIWYIHDSEMNKLNESKYGEFVTNKCYIVHYKYMLNDSEKHIIYYWIGRKSSVEEQGAALLKTIELDTKVLDGKALHVRIVEGKETIHFMSLFDGRIIIYQPEKINAIIETSDSIEAEESFMLQVRSYGHLNIKAFQVDYKASSLNTNDVFIVCDKSSIYYVWCGKGSTGDEREAAKSIVLNLKKEANIVVESQEKEDFWISLNGKQTYINDKRIKHTLQSPIARLFEILINNLNKINVHEIYQFSQEDLNTHEILLLDAWEVIFVWIGSGANKNELQDWDKIVQDYLKTDPSQRGVDVPVFKIKQGLEPPNFTGFFGHWDQNNFKIGSNYNEIKNELQSKNQPHLYHPNLYQTSKDCKEQHNGNINFDQYPKYSYDLLIKSADELPEDVSAKARELHLNEDEFEKIFNMSFEQWKLLPTWKQKELKRSAHLF